MAKDAPSWTPVEAAADWLRGKTADDFAIIEAEGRPTFLTDIRRRNVKTGELESVPVRVRMPNATDRIKARFDALEWVRALGKLKDRPSWEEACRQLGAEYVDQIDSVCLLARCMRDHDAPEHQHQHYSNLDGMYGRRSLLDLWERVNELEKLEDPRIDELTEDQFWTLIAAIDRTRSLGPLAGISGRARDNFVHSMAFRLSASRKDSSSSPSTET